MSSRNKIEKSELSGCGRALARERERAQKKIAAPLKYTSRMEERSENKKRELFLPLAISSIA